MYSLIYPKTFHMHGVSRVCQAPRYVTVIMAGTPPSGGYWQPLRCPRQAHGETRVSEQSDLPESPSVWQNKFGNQFSGSFPSETWFSERHCAECIICVDRWTIWADMKARVPHLGIHVMNGSWQSLSWLNYLQARTTHYLAHPCWARRSKKDNVHFMLLEKLIADLPCTQDKELC